MVNNDQIFRSLKQELNLYLFTQSVILLPAAPVSFRPPLVLGIDYFVIDNHEVIYT